MIRSLLLVAAGLLFLAPPRQTTATEPATLPLKTFYQSDADRDGLDDAIEEALARRFAPEFRFYQRIQGALLETRDPFQQALDPQATPRLAAQNQTEQFFPCAVDDFLKEPLPTGPTTCETSPTLYFHSYLFRIIPSGKLAKVFGRRGWTEQIAIEYWTFYTYDSKGLKGWLDHVGDWEHINLLIERRFDETGRLLQEAIVDAIYYGHGTERLLAVDTATNRCTKLVTKGIRVAAKDLLRVDGTHPMVFVSAGTHAAYPAPGIWQNLICQGTDPKRIGTYDDLFLGNGRVLNGWSEMTLVNLGEVSETGAADPFPIRDPKVICQERQKRETNLICHTGHSDESARPMPGVLWNSRFIYFGTSRDPYGDWASPESPGFHNVWGIHDPLNGYPYSLLPLEVQRRAGTDHTPWRIVIGKTSKIADGLGTLRLMTSAL